MMHTSYLVLLCYHSEEKPTEKATEKKEFLALIMTFELDLELQFAIQLHVYYHNMLLTTLVFSISLTTFLNVMHTKKNEY